MGTAMKIALAHKRLDLRGGTERVFFQTAIGLRDRGHEVHLFCQEFRMAVPQGIFAHRVPGISWPRTARLLTFGLLAPQWIARFNCDVTMSFDRLVRQDLFRSGGGAHKTFIDKMRAHGGWLKSLWYKLSPYHRLALAIERRQLSPSGSWKIIAVCDQTRREMIAAYGIAESRVEVIHNGVDHNRFHPSRRQLCANQIREEFNIPDEGRIILFVGTGFRRKGLDRLLRLWRHDAPPHYYLLVVGNDAHLASYRNVWRGNNQVIFAGARPNVEEFYAAADLLILPSVQEAFGNVVLEALASGVPVLTVAGVGALDKAGKELQEGILDNPDDIAEIKAKILRLSNPLRWPSLSRQARAVAERYSWDVYLDRVEALLFDFVKPSPHTAHTTAAVMPALSATQKMP
jgi:UDP-glucose:(heptosyl)LPS alpha-1,3-glucosyltransferase